MKTANASLWLLTLFHDNCWYVFYFALATISAVIKSLMRAQEDPDNQCKWAAGCSESSAICQAHLVEAPQRSSWVQKPAAEFLSLLPPPAHSPVELTVRHFHHMERNHGMLERRKRRRSGGDKYQEGGGQKREDRWGENLWAGCWERWHRQVGVRERYRSGG